MIDEILALLAQDCEMFSVMTGTDIEDPRAILRRDRLPGFATAGRVSTNRQCHLLRTRDSWIAINLAREEDRLTLPAWLEADLDLDTAAMHALVADRDADDLRARAVLLQLPVAVVGEIVTDEGCLMPALTTSIDPVDVRSLRVVDLSALWAGPLCAGLIARAGGIVTRFESRRRPDPTAARMPMLDAFLNDAKHRVSAELDDRVVTDAICGADILVTSGRRLALARAGLTEEHLYRLNPRLIWVAITAYGWDEPWTTRVGFGDDCAVAGGLVEWDESGPRFIGDALADPLAGMAGAIAALAATRRPPLKQPIDVALSCTAACYRSRATARQT